MTNPADESASHPGEAIAATLSHAPASVVASDGEKATVRAERPPDSLPREAPLPELDGFEILGRLGRGGMGVVYRARDLKLGRLVAIKVLRTGSDASDEERARFQREARVIAQLRHPHVVQIHEVGETAGMVYLVLELVNGGALSGYLDGQPVASTLAATIVAALCQGAAAAHRVGVVHRDLKPGNVLVALPDAIAQQSERLDVKALQEPGVVLKIADFGLAKSSAADESRTMTGVMMGTPRYAAPEQVEGNPRLISPATDVYSLGAILYELTTGAAVFRAADVLALLDAVRKEEPIAPRTLQPTLDRDLETICLKCLRKEPSARYATAEELGDDLGRWLRREPIHARPTGALERAVKWTRRNPGGAALVAVGAIALATTAALIVSMVFQAQLRRTNDELDKARVALKGKNDELEGQNTALERAKDAALKAELEVSKQRDLLARHRYAADTSAGGVAWRTGDIARVEAFLTRSAPASPESPDLRGFEWRYLKGLTRSQSILMPGRCATYSPDASLLAMAFENRVEIWDSRNYAVLRTLESGPVGVWRMAFSGDGQRLLGACQTQPFFRVWSVADGKLVAAYDKHTGWGRLALSPDGSLALTMGMSDDRTAKLWRVDTGETLLDWSTLPLIQYAGDVAFSPDGVWYAVGWPPTKSVRIGKTASPTEYVELPLSPGGSPLQFDPESKRLITSREGRVGWFELDNLSAGSQFFETGIVGSVLDLSWDGKSLVTAVDEDKSLRLWDIRSSRLINSRHGHVGGYDSFSFQGPTTFGVSSGSDQTLRFCETFEPQDYSRLPVYAPGPMDIEFSPDGALLAIATSQKVFLYKGNQVRELPAPPSHSWGVAFSPDGQLLAAADFRGVCRVWNVSDETLAEEMANDNLSSFFSVAFDEKGERLAASGKGGRVRMWEVAEWKPLPDYIAGQSDVYNFAFRPGSDEVVTSSGNGSILFSGKHSLRGWNTHTNDLAFTPDGSGLFVTSNNNEALLRDALTGETRTTFSGHQSYVSKFAVTSDGARLATASPDGTVKLWDIASGQETLSLPAPDPRAIAFSRDGRRLAVATYQGEVRVYDTERGYGE